MFEHESRMDNNAKMINTKINENENSIPTHLKHLNKI